MRYMADRAACGGAFIRRSDTRLVMVSLRGLAAGVCGRRLRALESGLERSSRSDRSLRWRRSLLKISCLTVCGVYWPYHAYRLHSQLSGFIQMEFSSFASSVIHFK